MLGNERTIHMSKRRYRHLTVAVQAGIMLGALGMFTPVWADSPQPTLPTGGISSTAIITESGNTMTVDGQVERNIIAWNTFDIDKGNVVRFGGNNSYLNYVVGSKLSEIYGSITGVNGSKPDVYLFNPNGIIFGEDAQINVGSLYASTKNLTMEDLQAFDEQGTVPTGGAVGDIVNRMESNLSGMNITLEGDTVTFNRYKDGKVNPGDATNVYRR